MKCRGKSAMFAGMDAKMDYWLRPASGSKAGTNLEPSLGGWQDLVKRAVS
jgi:hypothetical protein